VSATRLEELLSDVWAAVFAAFDAEPELTAEDAGRTATAAEDAARRAVLTLTTGFGSTTVEQAAGRTPAVDNLSTVRKNREGTR
jgi:hypothetical protein